MIFGFTTGHVRIDTSIQQYFPCASMAPVSPLAVADVLSGSISQAQRMWCEMLSGITTWLMFSGLLFAIIPTAVGIPHMGTCSTVNVMERSIRILRYCSSYSTQPSWGNGKCMGETFQTLETITFFSYEDTMDAKWIQATQHSCLTC